MKRLNTVSEALQYFIWTHRDDDWRWPRLRFYKLVALHCAYQLAVFSVVVMMLLTWAIVVVDPVERALGMRAPRLAAEAYYHSYTRHLEPPKPQWPDIPK